MEICSKKLSCTNFTTHDFSDHNTIFLEIRLTDCVVFADGERLEGKHEHTG